METIDLNQLTGAESGTYLLGDRLFSGFAIETFADGRPATQMSLMRGLQDGVTRRWHVNGQLRSEENFRNGARQGCHREWQPDCVLTMLSTWNAGAPVEEWRFDDQARPIQKSAFAPPCHPTVITYQCDEHGAAE